MTRLERLVPLLRYPVDGYVAGARRTADALDNGSLRAFADEIAALPIAALQEQYVETFDLDPDCALDLGWHLFGERYERGEWLAVLRGELRRAGVETTAELPDHLTNVLVLLARDTDETCAAELSRRVLPALDRVHAGLERRRSPFRHVLDAVRSLVSAQVPIDAGAGHD